MGTITAFHNATGVIGLREAEFAKTFWMKENKKFSLSTPMDEKTFISSRSVVKLVRVRFFDVQVETYFLNFEVDDVNSYLV